MFYLFFTNNITAARHKRLGMMEQSGEEREGGKQSSRCIFAKLHSQLPLHSPQAARWRKINILAQRTAEQ